MNLLIYVFCFSGGAAAYAAVTKTAVSATVVQNASLATGVASGALELLRQLYSSYCKYDERQTELNNLKKQLNVMKAKIEAQEIEHDEKIKKKTDLLFKKQ